MNFGVIIKNEILRKAEKGNKNNVYIGDNEDIILKHFYDFLKDNIDSLLQPVTSIDLSIEDISIKSEYPTNDRTIYSELKFPEGGKYFTIYIDSYIYGMDMISEENDDFIVSITNSISAIRYSDPENSNIPLTLEEDITPDKYPFLCLLLDNIDYAGYDGISYTLTRIIDNGIPGRYYQYHQNCIGKE